MKQEGPWGSEGLGAQTLGGVTPGLEFSSAINEL